MSKIQGESTRFNQCFQWIYSGLLAYIGERLNGKIILISIFCIGMIFWMQPALAFCGFYVGKADSSLYNKASQVVIAHKDNRTVLTMSNDYQGDVKDFALVVPVPVVIKEEQVKIGESKIIQRLDAFSAPRLVEYFDSDPCVRNEYDGDVFPSASAPIQESEMKSKRDNALGVTIEEQFTVGEYDILILSAKQSDGLEIWLRENGYKIPRGAREILQPYIRQKMKFFVAKVNLEEYSQTGFQSLRPLMITYESPKFMLPIRLGMINSQGEQDLIIYLLSPKGQTEVTNYRTVPISSDVEIPEFVQQKFGDFYKAMFQKSYEMENKKVAFLEYAWDMSSCDPCSAEPLSPEELKQAGVFWQDPNTFSSVFISRIHVRYTRDKFPEDLYFQETGNSQFFQGRYIIRHPFTSEITCDAGRNYQIMVRDRQEREARTLAQLTGWNLDEIRQKINFMQIKPLSWRQKLCASIKNIFQ